MGRPKKQHIEYFPHFVLESRTVNVLQSRWKNDGYACWYKLLEILGKSEGHCYDFSKTVEREYLISFLAVPKETAEDFLNLLAEIEVIDRELWEGEKIIWCQEFVDSLKAIYDKRTTAIPERPRAKEPEKKPESPPEQPAVQAPDPEPKQRKKAASEPKIRYAEFVHMTEKEYQKLVEQYGPENTKRFIAKLDSYKGSKGKAYKDDYRAILSWVVDEIVGNGRKETSYGEFSTPRGSGNPGGFVPSGGFRKN